MKRILLSVMIVLLLCGCTEAPIEKNPEVFIDTQYFTLTLPQSWRSGAVCNVVTDGDRYAIECFERQDYEQNNFGKLCTIKLFTEDENYTVFDHVAYGKLVTANVNYEVVVIYPDEVSFTPANAEQYNTLSLSIDELVSSLEPKAGCQWLVPQWDIPNPPDTEKVHIEMRYYTLTVPEDWKGLYDNHIEENVDGTSTVSFYELASFKTDYGGHLCTIELIPHGVDYSFYPAYEWVGVLETPEGDFDIVARFPTDVQFSKESAAVYSEMFEQVDELIHSLRPKDGIEMAMP